MAEARLHVRSGILLPEVPCEIAVYRVKADPRIRASAMKTLLRIQDVARDDLTSASPHKSDVAWFVKPEMDVEDGHRVDVAAARRRAERYFEDVLPDDGMSQIQTGEAFIVARKRSWRTGRDGEEAEESVFVRMDRFVGKARVLGAGSVAVAEVRDDEVVGLLIRWDPIVSYRTKKTIDSKSRDLATELRKLFPAAAGDRMDVRLELEPELVYVDDRFSLTPYYRIVVSVDRHDKTPPELVVKLLPVLVPDQANIEVPSAAELINCTRPITEANVLGVDRYVLYGAEDEWLRSARTFGRNVANYPGLFALQKFCWINAAMFEGQKNEFLNAPPISLVESHGCAGWIQWDVGTEPWIRLDQTGGLGSGGGGGLRLLILHSCEAIPTHEDNRNHWADVWWQNFKGLHTVLGYRTKMYIADGVPAAYVKHLADDLELIRSWLAEIVAVHDYGLGTKSETCDGMSKPLGRGSAVSVCRYGRAKRSELTDLPNPDCLVSYWLKD